MSAAEDAVWDELWDTDAANCCSCRSCNYYAPDYEAHKDEPCLLRTLIERIIAARIGAIPTHNGTPLSPKNLRWAATHEALCRSFIYDVLTGLADALDPSTMPGVSP